MTKYTKSGKKKKSSGKKSGGKKTGVKKSAGKKSGGGGKKIINHRYEHISLGF